jgi:putative spermidine/putrescine transport system permease protein
MHARSALALALTLCALLLAPLAWLIALSFTRGWRYPALWPQGWQWDAWLALGAEGRALAGHAGTSLLLALSVGLAATVAGFATSRALRAPTAGRGWLALAALPFAVSPVVYGACIGQGYGWLGLRGEMLGVFLAQLPLAYGYAVLLCHGFWTTRNRALLDLSRTLGASSVARLLRVELPLARGLLGLCLFQTALMSWFDFALVRSLGAGRVQTLSLAVFDYFDAGDLRLASASALVLIAPPALALLWNPALLLPAAARGEAA